MTHASSVTELDLSVVPCKCCGARARLYGAVDFNKTCEDYKSPVFAPSGVDIPYHRCDACGFVFTIAFDHFGAAEFHTHIYNDAYLLADPDFIERRPASNGDMLQRTFGHAASTLRVLDYGGGNGALANGLRARGFATAATYDPFYAGSVRPQGTFDLVTCFEVMEHTPTPRETLADILSFVTPGGLLMFSTLLQPADFAAKGTRWWYAAPRNGHVSLYAKGSIDALMREHALSWGSCHDGLHVAFRGSLPPFARTLTG